MRRLVFFMSAALCIFTLVLPFTILGLLYFPLPFPSGITAADLFSFCGSYIGGIGGVFASAIALRATYHLSERQQELEEKQHKCALELQQKQHRNEVELLKRQYAPHLSYPNVTPFKYRDAPIDRFRTIVDFHLNGVFPLQDPYYQLWFLNHLDEVGILLEFRNIGTAPIIAIDVILNKDAPNAYIGCCAPSESISVPVIFPLKNPLESYRFTLESEDALGNRYRRDIIILPTTDSFAPYFIQMSPCVLYLDRYPISNPS